MPMKVFNEYYKEAEAAFYTAFPSSISIIEGDDNNGTEPKWDAALISPKEVQHEFHYAVNMLMR